MTSSSGDSTVPLDFQTETSGEENKLIELPSEDCPLCSKARLTFFCKTCIQNGDFVHSSMRCSDRFADKRKKLRYYVQEKHKAQQLIETRITPHVKAARIESEIKACNERIRFLKFLIQEKKKTISDRKEKVKFLTNYNEEKKVILTKYENRVGKLKGFVNTKSKELKTQEAALFKAQDDLRRLRKTNICQLVRYIFPITVVKPLLSRDEDLDTVGALEDACRTAYVHGKWEWTNSSSELQHCIVAPVLPSSGDYSAYSDWVEANKDGVPSSGNTVDFNPAYNISAALTYTTQLVNMIAFYLDSRLPSKLCYSEFCTNELSKEKFIKRVARLNWNVLHLCLSQNVDLSLLKPESTLSNILHLIASSELGRLGACDVDPVAARALEDALRPSLELSSDSEDSEDDSGDLSYEWEAVTNVSFPEVEAGGGSNLTSQQHQLSSTSVAGGLITSTAASIASLWRGWATNR